MTDLSVTTLTWRGLTIQGTRLSRHWVASLEGWEDLPATSSNSQPRLSGHGSFGGAVRASERVVVATGRVSIPAERDVLLREIQAVMTLSDSSLTEDLTIENAGRTLTAGASLTRFRVSMENWSAGVFGWAAEWVCPDPLRYGAAIVESTGFATSTGGLQFPLFTDGTTGVGFLDFGEPGTSGRVTLTNPGTAAASPQFAVDGPVPDEGFDIACVETGERITFSEGVAAGSTVVLDSATGRVLLNGDADKSGSLTQADWFTIPPGGTRTVAFLSRGTTSDANMTVTVKPPWW